MRKHNVPINDLHTLTKGFSHDLFVAPGNVHYTKAGYRKIAEQVASKIHAAIKGEQSPGGDSQKAAPQE